MFHLPAFLTPMIYFRLAVLWWPVAGNKHVWLLCPLVTLNPCVQQYMLLSRFLSKAAFFIDFSTSILFSDSCPCVALRLSFLAISRFIFMASLSCVVRDTLFLVSASTAYVILVMMSLSATAAV